MFDVTGVSREQDIPMVRFARKLDTRATTQQLPVATREVDAPVRMARPSARLVPTAEHPAVLAGSIEQWRAGSIRRELLLRFDDQLDDARNIDVEVIDDCVVLRGFVSCPLAKLLAEDLAYSIPEILDCYNVLSVARTPTALSA